jgi:Carboxypeptidase regulatory-like domain/TonB dependent receptor/TonB-dependent Receptor Plug Domain
MLAGAMCLAIALMPTHTSAQNALGSIVGHITDPLSAPVRGAKVSIRNVNINITATTHTGALGDYVFVNVQPGTYELNAEAPGFKTAHAVGLGLDVGQTLRQDLPLEVGVATEVVAVVADAQMVQTDDAELGTVVPQKVIEELPISGRDFTNLLRLQAGATTTGGGVSWAWTMHGLNADWLSTSINGSRSESNSFLVDGISSSDVFFSAPSALPPAAAVAEFRVESGSYSAEYGQGAIQTNVAIKSGANQYHAQAYDYLQNSIFQPDSPLNKFLNAANQGPLPLPLNPPFQQNQYGFTLGGPFQIPKAYDGRDRSFWFFGYERGTQRSVAASRINTPTAQERSGNFSDWPYALYDPQTAGEAPATAGDPAGRLPFPGNQIPASRISPIAQNILQYIPTANVACPNPCTSGGNYQASLARPWDTAMTTIRGDENLNSNNRLFLTGVFGDQTFSNPSLMPLSGETKYSRQQLFGLNWQHIFTPSIFNEARIGYTFQRFQDASQTSYGPNIAAQMGFLNEPNVPAFFGPVIVNFNGYQTLGNPNSAWRQEAQTFQYLDNLKMIRGRHTLALGVDVRRMLLNLIDGFGGLMGEVNFTGAYTASNPAQASNGQGPGLGNAFADFLLGDPQTVSSPSPVPTDHYDVRGTNWNFFVQDNIRVSPRFTLNLGLRYELPPAFYATNNSGVALDRTNGGGYLWADPAFTQAVSPALGVNSNFIRCCVDHELIQPDRKDFAPRIGFAWRPFPTSRFVFRAGYGIFYDIYGRFYELSTFDDNSLSTAPAVSYPAGSGFEPVSPVALNKLWSPFPGSMNFGRFQLPLWDAQFQVNWPENHQPRTQQWSAGFEFAVTQNLLLDVNYVGSHGQDENGYWYFNAGYPPAVAGDPCNVWISRLQAQQNQPACLSDPNFQPVNTRDPYPNLDPLSYANANIFWSNYNSVQIRLNQRFRKGLQYQLNYSYSKSMDVLSEIGLIFGQNGFVQDPHNLRGDYGPSAFDQTHRLNAVGSYELPFGRAKTWDLGRWDWLIGGWQVSGTFAVATGMPYTVYAFSGGADQLGLNRGELIRPNYTGDPDSGPTSIYQMFNTSAFAAPELGRFGDVGRDTLRTPYYLDTDLAFGKNFRINERNQVKYKLEIFNSGSTWHSNENLLYPNNVLASSPAGCTAGPSGNCSFGSLVPLNGAGSLNLWNPRKIEMSLLYSF